MSIHSQQVEDVFPRIMDWPKVIEDIKATGLTYSAIANTIGAGWSTFQRYREGGEPRHSVGSSILLVHSRHCGIELTKPRVAEAEQ